MSLMVSEDAEHHERRSKASEFRSRVKVEVAVLSSPSIVVRTVSVDVKQHWNTAVRTWEPCESRGGRPELPVPNSPYGLCGRKATLNMNQGLHSCVNKEGELCEHGGRAV